MEGVARGGFYLWLALLPTQFLFIPVEDFSISPADVVGVLSVVGLLIRLAGGSRRAWAAVLAHRYLLLMIASYVAGFIVLDVYSRTVTRVGLAIVPSILACELLRTRQQLKLASAALIVAAVIDVAYGIAYYVNGVWLHPSRFSGMSGVNFSAMLLMTGAAIGFGKVGQTKHRAALLGPGVLMGFGLATFSQTGLLAFFVAWLTVLRRIVSKQNKMRLVAVAVVMLSLALSQETVRDKLAARNDREIYADGVARNSLDIRWMALSSSWHTFTEHPVLGVGYSQALEYSSRDPEIGAATSGAGIVSHNTYTEILAEGGLLAGMLFALHFGQYLPGTGLAFSAIRRGDATVAAATVGFPMMLVAAGLANVLLHYSFWSTCGLYLACLNLLRAETKRTPPVVQFEAATGSSLD